MSRSQRLFDLLQHLRCHKYPVSAATLARELGVSVRTVYRDIATLQAQGAEIEGEAGLGYILKPGFTLPPLMFSVDELEALLMGAEWISSQANGEFSVAAQNAIAKISAVLPTELKL
ncbi:HTH domain-containing protein [Photobacterium sp. CCB-ST2H9]|nr:HTH domain-containing protein [Photobacterium sp. CCB-ST2H9]UTM57090.1 HTH domain-containing protein [Photobacterium sp. CCB-ST2H9]